MQHKHLPHKQNRRQQHSTGKNNLEVLKRTRKNQENQGKHSDTIARQSHMPQFALRQARLPADTQQIEMPTQQAIVVPTLSDVMTFFSSMNRVQIMSLCFLILVAGAHAVDVVEKVGQAKDGQAKGGNRNEKRALKQKAYREVCTDTSRVTYNKPNITLGTDKAIITPKACVTKDSVTCKTQSSTLSSFRPDFTNLHKQRAQRKIKFNEWILSIQNDISAIHTTQNSMQNAAFDNILNTINQLKNSYFAAILSRQAKGGNCGEHTNSALIALLNKKMQYGLEMKIQYVDVFASQSKNEIIDHVFLLLDSNINDVDIKNDAVKVKNVFNSIQKGKICDSWNHGYFADFKTDDSGFYKSEAGWDSLKIETFSLNFADINKLSQGAQRFVCNQLQQIGLYVEPREACRKFRKPAKTQTVDQQTQVKKEMKAIP